MRLLHLARQKVDAISKRLQINRWEDWYSISHRELMDNGAGQLLVDVYNNSRVDMIQHVFPEYKWLTWKFTHVPSNYWKEAEHQRQFLDWVATQLNIKQWEDWYDITQHQLSDQGAGHVMGMYHNNSPSQMLMSVYPEYQWLEWCFGRVPHSFWGSIENRRQYMDWIAQSLSIHHYEEWYHLTQREVIENGGFIIAHKLYNNSTSEMIQSLYPEYNWVSWKFTWAKLNLNSAQHHNAIKLTESGLFKMTYLTDNKNIYTSLL